jgi:hypothetical protein
VPEMSSDATERVVFQCAVAVGFQIAVAEIRQGWLGTRRHRRRPLDDGDGTIVPDEGHDVAAGWQEEQPLVEAHQEVFHLIGLGPGLRLGDAANREIMLFSPMSEDYAIAAVSLLDRGHDRLLSGQCHPNATPGLLPNRYQDLW